MTYSIRAAPSPAQRKRFGAVVTGSDVQRALRVVTWAMYGRPLKTKHKKRAILTDDPFFIVRCLAMTYSHMGKPHTTIGDDAFHC